MRLLYMSFAGGILIVLTALLRLAGGRWLPRRLFPALWLLVALRLLLPAAIPLPGGVSRRVERAVPVISEVFKVMSGTGGQNSDAESGMPAAPDSGTAVDPGLTARTDAGASQGIRASVPAIVWAAGAMVTGAYFLVSWLRFRREFGMSLPLENEFAEKWLREHPIKRRIGLRSLKGLPSPLTYGVLRPVILVPGGMELRDEPTARYMLYHEFTHIRRFDGVRKFIAAAALCVHWFNPLVWVMYVLMGRDTELACDERVIRHFGLDEKKSYAMALIDLEGRRMSPAPFTNCFNKSSIEGRIKAIMRSGKKSVIALVLALVLVTAGTAAAFFVVSDRDGGSEAPQDLSDDPDAGKAGATEVFKYGGLRLEVTNVTEKKHGSTFDGFEDCPYDIYVLDPGAVLTVLEANMAEDVDGVSLADWAIYTSDGGRIDIVDGMEPLEITSEIEGVYDPESSLFVLKFQLSDASETGTLQGAVDGLSAPDFN